MKKLVIFFVMLQFAFVTNAVVYQKIVLKNGTQLNGFIQQNDREHNMIVKTENAIVCLKNINVTISGEKLINESSLTEAWKNWAETNQKYKVNGSENALGLVDLNIGMGDLDSTAASKLIGFENNLHRSGKSFSNVRLLEQGSYIRFLEMTPNTYKINWSDVVSITSDRRPDNALSGINRKITLIGGRELTGQYAGQTEYTMSLYMNGGVVETVETKDIQKYSYFGINPSQDIFAQSELLDVVSTKSVGELHGVIIEQNYLGKKDEENYISIWVKGQSPTMVKIPEVLAINKEENPDYQPKFDIILKEGEVVVNRNEIEYVGIKEDGELLILDSLNQKIVIEKGNNTQVKLAVEMRMKNVNAADMFQLIKVKKSEQKKKTIYGFSYKDLVNGSIRSNSVETSVNGTTRIEFTVNGAGNYALYDAKEKRAIPITIK